MKWITHHTRIKRVGLAAAIALLFLFITLICSDNALPLSSEKVLFKNFEFLKHSLLHNDKGTDSMLDSVLLINTHYAQTLVDEIDGVDTLGKVPVTNRQLLFRLLNHLHDEGTYKYVLLDISLDKNVRQDTDTALYQLIDSMPRIGIAMPEEMAIADTSLSSKAGEVGYYITHWENDFIKYPYLLNDRPSLPLKMYEELTGRTIHKHGLLYTDGGLVRSSVFLTYDFTDYSFLYDLGSAPFDARGRYVLIGDFNDDVHNTYIDTLPGVIINFNAYLTLLNGHHRVKFGMLLILFASFFLLVYQTLTQSRFTWLFMWVGYPVFLTVICFVIYYLYNEVYDILITTSLYYLLKTIVECRRECKLIRERMQMIVQTVNGTAKTSVRCTAKAIDYANKHFIQLANQINKKKKRWKDRKKTTPSSDIKL